MEFLASGRDSVVYAIDDRRVLRCAEYDTTNVAQVMRYMRDQGYPVPVVYRAEGGDIEMERLHGPTLAEEVINGRMSPAACVELIRELHSDLHRIEPPAWLATRSRRVDLTGRGADRVLHLDLHPENIMLTEAGPVVIDWNNAAAGDPDVDRAVTWAIFAGFDPTPLGPALASGFDRMLDQLLDGLPQGALDTALRYRQLDSTLEAVERQRLRTRFEQAASAHG